MFTGKEETKTIAVNCAICIQLETCRLLISRSKILLGFRNSINLKVHALLEAEGNKEGLLNSDGTKPALHPSLKIKKSNTTVYGRLCAPVVQYVLEKQLHPGRNWGSYRGNSQIETFANSHRKRKEAICLCAHFESGCFRFWYSRRKKILLFLLSLRSALPTLKTRFQLHRKPNTSSEQISSIYQLLHIIYVYTKTPGETQIRHIIPLSEYIIPRYRFPPFPERHGLIGSCIYTQTPIITELIPTLCNILYIKLFAANANIPNVSHASGYVIKRKVNKISIENSYLVYVRYKLTDPIILSTCNCHSCKYIYIFFFKQFWTHQGRMVDISIHQRKLWE